MKNFVLIFSIFCLAINSYGQEKKAALIIEPTQFEEMLSVEEGLLIDVRTPEEFKEGHIPDAININFLSDDFLEHFENIDKNKRLYIYCRSGNRSGKAAIKLHQLGYKDIVDLKGGFMSWSEYQDKIQEK